MTTPLTPQQAADRAGCARSSIMRALSLGNLKASRNNLGHWLIDPAVLDDWLSMRSPVRHSPSIRIDTSVDTPSITLDSSADTALSELRRERDEARLEAAAMRAEAVQLRERLGEARSHMDDARVDRDRWRDMAERLARHDAEQPTEPQLRPTLLARLLGLSRPRSV